MRNIALVAAGVFHVLGIGLVTSKQAHEAVKRCNTYELRIPKQDKYEEYDPQVNNVLNAVRRDDGIHKLSKEALERAVKSNLIECTG